MSDAPALRPIDPADPDVRKLAVIELALRRRVPWSAIATALGVRDKRAAKRVRNDLDRRVRIKQHATRTNDAAASEPARTAGVADNSREPSLA